MNKINFDLQLFADDPLQKSTITSGDTLSGGGKLTPEQSDKFLMTLQDETLFLKEIQMIKMNSPQSYIEILGIGKRLIRKATEDTAPTNTATPNHSRRELKTVETILPVDITYSYLEDNIEGDKAEDVLIGAFTKQFGNDTIDLGFNGDEEDTTSADKDFLSINNGWLKIARKTTEAKKIDASFYDYSGKGKMPSDLMKAMLKEMPEKYKTDKIVFLCSPNFRDEYIDEISKRSTGLGDKALTEGGEIKYKGYTLKPIPCLSDGDVMLTHPLNIAYGVQRDISIEWTRVPRKRRIEYTITARTDYEFAEIEAIVVTEAREAEVTPGA